MSQRMPFLTFIERCAELLTEGEQPQHEGRPVAYTVAVLASVLASDPSWVAIFKDGMSPEEAVAQFRRFQESRQVLNELHFELDEAIGEMVIALRVRFPESRIGQSEFLGMVINVFLKSAVISARSAGTSQETLASALDSIARRYGDTPAASPKDRPS